MTRIRAIIYGVGEIGKIAVRLMIEKGVEVVAAINRPGAKIGMDLGELIGLQKRLGVIVRNDAHAVLSETDADIVFVSVGDSMEQMYPIYVQCIEHGFNVITVGSEASFSWHSHPKMTKELHRLALKHRVTITGSGNQDLFMVDAASIASGACHRIESVIHRSITDVNKFGANVARLAYVGKSIQEYRQLRREERANELSVYSFFWRNFAADLGLTITKMKQITKPLTANEKVKCDSLGIEVGRGRMLGIVEVLEFDTKERISLRGEYQLKLLLPGEKESKSWSFAGEPNLELEFRSLSTGFTTASQPVNRIPDVINSEPGYVTIEKLPKLKYRSRPLASYVTVKTKHRR